MAAVMRKAKPGSVATDATSKLSSATSSSSAALPDELRGKLAKKLGHNLDGVRIHTGAESAAASEAVSARAYTQGQNIHFGDGQYDPSSKEGQRLIAHEVAHTVQQQSVSGAHQNKLSVSEPGDARPNRRME